MVTLAVPFEVLNRARTAWDAAADELDGAWRRLDRASTSGFSADVVAAVEAFRTPWVDEVKASAVQAQGYSDEITFFRRSVVITDEDQAERIRATLPWGHHDARIGG